MQVLAQDIKRNSRNSENKTESECWPGLPGRREQSTKLHNNNPIGDIEVYLEDFMEELTNLPVQASTGAFQWSVRERTWNLKLAYMLALIDFRRM